MKLSRMATSASTSNPIRSRFAGQEAPLTSEEFDLLVFLVGHPRSVVTSRTLLSTRCGAHEVRQAQFLRVLATLRHKIESAAGREGYIRTEPWIVYRFDPAL